MKIALDENAHMPTRAHDADAGYDLYASDSGIIAAGKTAEVSTGVHIEIPKGYCGLVKSRSGLHMKYGITTTGVVDSGFAGAIKVKLTNHEFKTMIWSKGDRIAQLVIVPVYTPELELVDISEFEKTERGDKGFGSSGV